MNVTELTRQLIDIPSVTGDEWAMGMFLKKHLEHLGYFVQMQEVAAGRTLDAYGHSATVYSIE
jgi:acetylornithine deacetylase/succinyl-diaminopimelate desuccinylase-like protein